MDSLTILQDEMFCVLLKWIIIYTVQCTCSFCNPVTVTGQAYVSLWFIFNILNYFLSLYLNSTQAGQILAVKAVNDFFSGHLKKKSNNAIPPVAGFKKFFFMFSNVFRVTIFSDALQQGKRQH